MKAWLWLTAIAVMAGSSFVACSDDSRSSSGDGGGGEGGDTTTTGSKAASTGAGMGGAGQGGAGQGGAGQGGAGGGGTGTCDDKGLACGSMADPGCQGCAQMGACMDEAMACQAVPQCPMFNNCINMCPMNDMACQMKCTTDFPMGVMPQQKLVVCVLCEQCKESCMTPDAQCPP
jgi:hypothetical protein